ncbi:hypothetical protein CQW23_19144 [Capsicum baccatum]|uniref:Uncharacterized protein n=1 Tax=Capsicum baccatum TaxID=33114 RepID=A0A2G2W4Y6_CAPBA|nr:hypothetical protein CQW23_19144 [Capsicum baccatum]
MSTNYYAAGKICRVGSLNSRCSINTDVLTDISTDQEVRDDVATDDYGYTVPVLRLKSDILETDALNLLAKGQLWTLS